MKIRSNSGDVELTKLNNLMSIAEVKQLYIKKLGDKSPTLDNLRLFCMGRELKDEMFMYTYGIVDGWAIQAMIK